CLARAGQRTLKQRAIRRAVRNTERRALTEARPRRKVMQLRGDANCALRIRAGARGSRSDAGDVHAIARLEVLDVGTDRLHVAGSVLPRGVREWRLAGVHAAVHVRVDRIYAGSADTHDDVSRTRFRIGNVLELQHGRSAELVHANRFHVVTPARLKPRAPAEGVVARAPAEGVAARAPVERIVGEITEARQDIKGTPGYSLAGQYYLL